MRISSVELHHLEIPLKSAFKHARKERTRAESIIVRLTTDEKVIGHGEILPRAYVTGETLESVLEKSAPPAAHHLVGRTFSTQEEVLTFLGEELDRAERRLATFSGFELALLDAAGRTFGFAL